MNENYKVGAVVALKSGGPDMTVVTYPAYNGMGNPDPSKAKCAWFVNGEPKYETFPVDALEVV